MGLLDKLLGKSSIPPSPEMAALASSPKLRTATDELLERGITGMRHYLIYLLKDFYSQQGYGDEAIMLSCAIVNYAVAEEDRVDREGSEKVKQYKAQKHELIRSEAAKICFQTPDAVQVLPYLYAAELLYLNIFMFSAKLGDKKWAFDKAHELTERANELGVILPNQYEICGRHDAPYSCAQVLEAFASNLPLDDLWTAPRFDRTGSVAR